MAIRWLRKEQATTKLTVEKLSQELLNVRSKVKLSHSIKSKEVAVTESDIWEKKTKLLKNKHKLRESNIFFDDDLAEEERRMQSKKAEQQK